MTKAILFDFDGTLLDSVPDILCAAEHAAFVVGIPFDPDQMRGLIGLPLADEARVLAGDRGEEWQEAYRGVYTSLEPKLFPGTVEMLERLQDRGYKLAVVTSKRRQSALRQLTETGIEGLFDAVISCEDVERPKPEPDCVLKALDVLGVQPDEAVFVGDSLFDAAAARGAGVTMVGVSWGARTREKLAEVCDGQVFDTWPEFLESLLHRFMG
jgi:pyrophosphatase PpaX